MNRLDEIEQNLGGLTSRGASAFLSLNDIFALVAVAREAKNVCEVYSRSDQYSPSIECLIIALAPLLEQTSADAGAAHD